MRNSWYWTILTGDWSQRSKAHDFEQRACKPPSAKDWHQSNIENCERSAIGMVLGILSRSGGSLSSKGTDGFSVEVRADKREYFAKKCLKIGDEEGCRVSHWYLANSRWNWVL